MRILCVGGGPAGLHLAALVKQRSPNHEVTVVERNPEGVTYGWGIVGVGPATMLDALAHSSPDVARAIADAALAWDTQVLDVNGRRTEYSGRGGFSIGRHRLLEILTRQAREVGVRVEFSHPVESLHDLPAVDLVVAADGAGSTVRQELAAQFRTTISEGRNKYVWLGTTRQFDGFTFALVETTAGWIWFHGYPFGPNQSTCVVEAPPETWRGLGLDRLDTQGSVRALSSLFAGALDGHPLLDNGSVWRSFRTVRNQRWHHENVVLLGDAAHTTHFTIGSGTTLAMEDAAVLADALYSASSATAAVTAYEVERRAGLEQAQSEARFSAAFFENIERYVHLGDEALFTVLRERRSPLLARIPPRLYYLAHLATERVGPLGRLRARVGPRARASYSRRFG